MAARTANVLARVEPEVKAEAEEIMSELGVPASVVINMLYKQIIMKKRIPFDLSLTAYPKSREEMSEAEFDDMMSQGLREAQAGASRNAHEAIADIRKDISSWA